MHSGPPRCAHKGVQNTGGTGLKTTMAEKAQDARKDPARLRRQAPGALARMQQGRALLLDGPASDRQAVEFERVFSARWEW